MRFMLLVYNDPKMLDAMPATQFDSQMRGCLSHADELRHEGKLFDSQMLESHTAARSLRSRNGKLTVVDGPFAETKEVLAGFNLIEADSMEEAERIAASFPWISSGCVEIRPVRDIDMVRQRVGAG